MTPTLPSIKAVLATIAAGGTLSEGDAEHTFDLLMSGDVTPSQMGALLMGMRVRGETIDEITGAARAMRAKALAVEAPAGAIDTCGTGGDVKGTHNISTAAAIVLAGCGVTVAKHGNVARSSKSGSADVLAALGVNLEADLAAFSRSLEQARIGFMLAQRHHGAMRNVGPTRVELGTATIFNILGPLANPAGTRRQLIGVYADHWIRPMAEVLNRLGCERAWVVHGSDGMDELTTCGTSRVAEVRDGTIAEFEIDPTSLGLPLAQPSDLAGDDAATNAAAIRALLAGQTGPLRDIVLLNAAAGLVVADAAVDLTDGLAQGAAAIESGAAAAALDKMARISRGG
ncbi:MAG: anthranilate phosphoribosyltransferase [Alphaproteobacteria bacterium]